VADAGEDQTGQTETPVQLNGSGSHDVDNNPLTYFWSFTSKPEGSTATLSNETTLTPTFTPDLAGTYVLQLIVNDGQLDSDPDTVTITVPDTTPPAPADIGKITVGPIINGQVMLTGSAGSVEGGATVTITNSRTNEVVTVTANADGSFSAQIGVQAGDSLSIIVTDSAGNNSAPGTVTVGGNVSVVVTITSPAAGVALTSNQALVRGTVIGPPNTGVTVNGIVATVQNGQFLVNHVPLVAGSNTLTAIATTPTGQTVTVTREVSSTGTLPTLELKASPESGVQGEFAALPVTFTYQLRSASPALMLAMDFDGDGTFEATDMPPDTILSGGYGIPGLHIARLQVTDQQGQISTAEVGIVVHDVVTMDAMFKGLWDSMHVALLTGDKATALTFLTARAREVFDPVFEALLPHMTEVVASFTAFQGVKIREGYAEYALNRTLNGENHLFLIYFLKDADGVWRLEAM
jgi:hypothetical protein